MMKKKSLTYLFIVLFIGDLFGQIVVNVPSIFYLRTVSQITEGQTIEQGMAIFANLTDGEIRVEPAADSDITFVPFSLTRLRLRMT
jgi:hypothetical protein